MDISLFDYHLPRRLIAQYPHRQRNKSRLLVLHRGRKELEHRRFSDLPEYLGEGDALVINDTKVFKARLLGERSTGAWVEILLVRQEADSELWLSLVRPSRRLKPGEEIAFGNKRSLVLSENLGEGRWRVQFSSRTARNEIVSRYGHVPLPPYISRDDAPTDIRRYQTVYADPARNGAVAAPTAGFHFSRTMLTSLIDKGVTVAPVTLHVGPGTFRPVQTREINDHAIDSEPAELSAKTALTLDRIRKRQGKIVAVGTTSVRVLESAKVADGKLRPFNSEVGLFIKPGYKFRLVDNLVTNFHLPKSSLLLLVSALAGRERIMDAYAEAIKREYRFYSYGDAMLIL